MSESAARAMLDALRRRLPAACELRRQIHAEPELSGSEHATRKLVADALPRRARIFNVADTGFIAKIGDGPGVGVRAELDALPVHETAAMAWRSRIPGVMHACGHDVHMAALWAVTHAVADVGGSPPLVAVFQPREETYPSGARDIVASGLLAETQCRRMLGVHVQPAIAIGSVSCVAGAVNASSDEFTITVTGLSGHAAYPHRACDPVVALANVIVSLQSVASRAVDPMHPFVLGVSTLRAGRSANSIPDRAVARGTMRALSAQSRTIAEERLEAVTRAVALAHGCSAEVEIVKGEPVLVNDEETVRVIRNGLRRHGAEIDAEFRSVGSDDFSYYAEAIPSAMVFVGTEARSSLHSGRFLPTDDDVARVAEVMLVAFGATSAQLVGPQSDVENAVTQSSQRPMMIEER